MAHPYEGMSLEQVLAWLKLSRWDPNLLVSFFPTLMNLLPSTPPEAREELTWVIHEVGDNYYDIGEPVKLSFCLGKAGEGSGLSDPSRFGKGRVRSLVALSVDGAGKET